MVVSVILLASVLVVSVTAADNVADVELVILVVVVVNTKALVVTTIRGVLSKEKLKTAGKRFNLELTFAACIKLYSCTFNLSY